MSYLKSFAAIFRCVIASSSSVKTTFQSSLHTLPQVNFSSLRVLVNRSKPSLQASSENSINLHSQQQHMSYAFATKTLTPNPPEDAISYHPCSVGDREEMIKFMLKLFVQREPLMKAFGLTPQNAEKYVAYNIDDALDHNASFVAVNDTSGRICGLRVNSIGLRNPKELQTDFGSESNAFAKFMHFVEGDMDDLLNTERCMRHIAICVDPYASQCGIATELMNMSVNFAKKQKLLGLMAMCSWTLPYILATKMGYKVVKTTSYDEYASHNHWLSKQQVQSLLHLASKEGAARVLTKRLR